jgi:iron complex transport system ATP-binding protein
MLAVENLTAGYGEIIALRHVSVTVDRGDMVAIVGPNGSGKSTLLRVLSGVLSPAAGCIRIAGRALSTYPRRHLARLVAVVPQDTLIDFPFSVEEIVLMGRAPHLGRAVSGFRALAMSH